MYVLRLRNVKQKMAGMLAACSTAAAQPLSPSDLPVRTITVTGSGQVFLSPDIANISIGVHTEAEDAERAVADSNAQTQSVVQMLKDSGVATVDIQTANFSIYPRQDFDDQGRVRDITYVVENTVRVTVRDLDAIGELLNAVVESGANNVYGIQFDVEDRVNALSDARKAAVDNARSVAEEMAQAAGVELGPLHSITVYGNAPTQVFEERAMAADAAGAVPISPGQLSLTVEVNVVYEIQ
jgi:uncharacterized protein YggE